MSLGLKNFHALFEETLCFDDETSMQFTHKTHLPEKVYSRLTFLISLSLFSFKRRVSGVADKTS